MSNSRESKPSDSDHIDKETVKRLVLERLTPRLKDVSFDELMNKEFVGSIVVEQPKHKSRLVSSYDKFEASEDDEFEASEDDEFEASEELMKIASKAQDLKCENSVPPSKKQRRIMDILEFYLKNYKLAVPRKVLIDEGFCRHMLKSGLCRQDICDILLSKDVQLYITSCSTGELMCFEIPNEDQRKSLIGLTLSLTELSCGPSCLKARGCVETFVQNGNPGGYFVATKNKSFVKDLLEMPGVAVISAKSGGKLILKEPSATQKKIAEKKECTVVMAPLSSRKRKNVDMNDESEMKGRRVKAKLMKKTDGVKHLLQKETLAEKEMLPSSENLGCKTLFMGGLSSSVKENDVYDFFSSVGRINEVRISQRKKRSVPFAHVEFLTVEAAREAINLSGKVLHGRRVRLDYAEQRVKVEEVFGSDIGKMVASGSRGRGHRGRDSWRS